LTTFISGYPPSPDRLLARFLPPLADGVAAHYVDHYSRPGDVILDPFGQASSVAVEALRLGRRVVVANFNPVSRLALSLAVRPPTQAELRSALTPLADARKDDERLENHVLNLYRTACADCGSLVSADVFEWEAEADAPVTKIYICPQCGGPPKHSPTDAADLALARQFSRGSLDYHLLLNRVAPLNDPDRPHAEEALAVYPARTVTAIATALVKIDSLSLPPDTRRLLHGLLIAAFDATCTLAQERPKVLSVPRRYRETNFWRALEKALGTLAGISAPNYARPLADLLLHEDGPAVYAHAAPVRDLAPLLPEESCALVIAGIPRPNQAYWTLSALWSAWLWGRASASALRSVLRRRRYDWSWHENAVRHAFTHVKQALKPSAKMIGLAAEAEPGFTACVLSAADGAGYDVVGRALRADTAEAQLVWGLQSPDHTAAPVSDDEMRSAALGSARAVLLARAEPTRWMNVHFGAWSGLAQKRLLSTVADDPVSTVNRLLDPVFRDERNFRRLEAQPDDDLTTGLWALPDKRSPDVIVSRHQPLTDRVEAQVLRLLSSAEQWDEHDLIQAVCDAFTGPHTPGRNTVRACLGSYAQEIGPHTWQLRPEDASAARAKELESIQAELRTLAVRHGYDVAGANPQEWRDEGQTAYVFALITSAVFSGHFLGRRATDPLSVARMTPARRRFLVLPGGRAGLVAYKLRRDPRLLAAMQEGNWQILKFRHVRRMAGDPHLTRATLEPAFYGDPLEEAESRQLPLLKG
jgi:hypothetical protein